MTADLMPFTYQDAAVRVVILDGEPWFVARDICNVIGLSNVTMALQRLAADEKGVNRIDTPGGPQDMATVSESGMYSLVLRSDKPGAVEFRRWITGEVLPAIRKTGGYGQTVERLTPLEYARQLVAAEERAESERAARIEAERHVRALEAPASAWSHLAESAGDYAVADAAKVLSRDPNITIGRDRLFAFMAAEGWIYRDKALGAWKAYQTQVNLGRLVEKLGRPYLHEPTGAMRNPAPTIRITAKGLAELHKRLGGGEQPPMLAVAE
ncbi:phage antirepressor KilAC domain-containing protein [Nocardia cyriacigeorgica]|uniref:phage antirepressor KilAC domain-containing protein n=1 Tax=Nocardia cyriacigeorgica TaxID=135487 RepID=UPI002456C642|nr:phage antirepressor KilAC domain-containing protein [Nocardia cyriacigeorgica]